MCKTLISLGDFIFFRFMCHSKSARLVPDEGYSFPATNLVNESCGPCKGHEKKIGSKFRRLIVSMLRKLISISPHSTQIWHMFIDVQFLCFSLLKPMRQHQWFLKKILVIILESDRILIRKTISVCWSFINAYMSCKKGNHIIKDYLRGK